MELVGLSVNRIMQELACRDAIRRGLQLGFGRCESCGIDTRAKTAVPLCIEHIRPDEPAERSVVPLACQVCEGDTMMCRIAFVCEQHGGLAR